MGAKVRLYGPSTLIPPFIEDTGAKLCSSIEEAVYGADVVMGLRIQLERQKKGLFPTQREYTRFFGLNENIVKLAKKDALVMHPGPMNRGLEISSGLADSDMSVINKQVTNGVAVRMALLYLLTRRNGSEIAY